MKKKSATPLATEEDYMVVKRNGKLVSFRKERIHFAVIAAFKEKRSPLSEETVEEIQKLTDLVAEKLLERARAGSLLTVESIQDFVEISLMQKGFHDVAKAYILYRNERKKEREMYPKDLKIFRKDKETLVRFNPIKIASSIERALRCADGSENVKELVETINHLSEKVIDKALTKMEDGSFISILEIQDAVEDVLMEEKFFQAAKALISRRAKKEEQFVKAPMQEITGEDKTFILYTKEGKEKKVTQTFLRNKLAFAARGFEDVVNVSQLLQTSIMNFYEGMKEEELDLANIFAARASIEKDPAYAKVAARLLLDAIYRQTLGISFSDPDLKKTHEKYFTTMIKKGIRLGRLHPSLLDFDLDFLAKHLSLENDDLFLYLGLQTLYDRYFLHEKEVRLETPQIFWMRVAMGLASKEEKKNERAIEFYEVLSKFHFISSTPTLFNAGTMHPQLSSCYLSTVQDDLESIFKLISDDAMLSKWAGGLGNDWTPVRSTGSAIHGTNGKSQGVIPFLKVANDTAVAVNQCFHPETLIYTPSGVKEIRSIKKGDLVLEISGRYTPVTETYTYEQKGPMCEITLKDGSSLLVTDQHPFYAKQCEDLHWRSAKELNIGDYLTQIIPQEVVESDLTEEDIEAYGAFLSSGFLTENGHFLCLETSHPFLEKYLEKRGFSLEKKEGLTSIYIEKETTGSCSESYPSLALPFSYEDIYGAGKEKRIAPKLSHLPPKKTEALLRGITQNKKEIQQEEQGFLFQIKYQYLRLGIATSLEDDKLRILGDSSTLEKHIFVEITAIKEVESCPFVCDLLVETGASYMTSSALAHNGGKRKGAMCAYLETWHLDIEDFLELRKNTGDERRRTHDMNTANWIPDLFMKRVENKEMWTLFSPSDVPDLHDLYGEAFEKRYEEYEKMAEEGSIPLYKKVEAALLWRKMLSMLFETGHPWITFKDPSNIRSPQDHMGTVHSSNLCTEILLNTNKEEVAVCNLGSVNLKEHIRDGKIEEEKLKNTIQTAIRMLDNVIDINFYPIPEAKNANLRHRPIGLGMMGFQDALYLLEIPYGSEKAASFADESSEMIAYYAYLYSSDLAKERGKYSSYKGSKWDRGLLPLDTIDLLEKERKEKIAVPKDSKMPWEDLRKKIAKQGMRNSNVLAIAPTATIANIAGVIPSIEPMYKHLFVKSNLSGEFTTVNFYLVEKLKKLGLWDEEMIDDLKYFDGSIQEIERIPADMKELFSTAFETDFEWIIECAARRQKWIDMGQSLNLYLAEPSGKKLLQMYFLAWRKGLKTTYYLRTLAATQVEKSSTDINKRSLQPRWMKNKSASGNITVQRNVSCSLEEGCESCQ